MSKTQQRFNANSILGSLCENMRHLHIYHQLKHQMNQKSLTASLIFTATKLNPIDEMSKEGHLEGSYFCTKTCFTKSFNTKNDSSSLVDQMLCFENNLINM
mmetsp:Transcript_24539/g.54759  ORF Transcript_24539/g.54759 Transcript_24539/m.54759 type:complete len:101 (-) Transcript_24539:207-509(-)